MIRKYDHIQDDIFVYIWNRMTAEPDMDEIELSAEIVNRFPTWIGFCDVNKNMQNELCSWLILQARFYRENVLVKSVKAKSYCPNFQSDSISDGMQGK